MTLGQRIQQIRVERGLSQEDFAEKLGTTRQSVSRWELDQAYPELAKIVLMSRVFAVSIDSILKNGISTFDTDVAYFTCGVWRGPNMEIVETEQFALVLSGTREKGALRMGLYKGYENKKQLVAVCERNLVESKTEYAFFVEGSDPPVAAANDERLTPMLGMAYDPELKTTLQRRESFCVDHEGAPLPTVAEAGIPKCLNLWRMVDSYFASGDEMHFFLCTGKTEYTFSIRKTDTDVYCGATYTRAFDLGLAGGGQFFRIRNYKDNSEPWCRFFSDFSMEPDEAPIPTERCEIGKCIETGRGYLWCVKRYTDDEIVLQGCSDMEYHYRRNDQRTEQFTFADARP